MHTNYRRKVITSWRGKGRYFISAKPYKKLESSFRRARERHCIENGKYDALHRREPKSILWDWY